MKMIEFLIEYLRGILWLKYFSKKQIYSGGTPEQHYCNVISSSVVCFETNGELWVKEYGNHRNGLREGRTYRVNFCPWCGFHENIKKMR